MKRVRSFILLVAALMVLGVAYVPAGTNAQEADDPNYQYVNLYLSFQGIPSNCGIQLYNNVFHAFFREVGPLVPFNYTYPNAATDSCGWYSARMLDESLPKVYHVRVKPRKSLAQCQYNQYLTNGTTMTFTDLRGGDAEENNTIDVGDFNIVKAEFGKVCGQSGWTGRADFNNDCLVDTLDYNIMRSNFGTSGCPVIPGSGNPEGAVLDIK